jgi:hypothetical protein
MPLNYFICEIHLALVLYFQLFVHLLYKFFFKVNSTKAIPNICQAIEYKQVIINLSQRFINKYFKINEIVKGC